MADYTEFNRLASSMPQEGPDVEQFYTPELQQMILDQLTRQAQEGGARNQAAISGGAITSGFGIGGTSREASRRARADADMLDQIVSGFVGQAAQIENQRVAQREAYQKQKLGAEESVANEKQRQEMAKQGYAAQFDAQQRELSDQSRNDRQDMLFGGLVGLGGAAGSLFGSMGQQTQSPPAYNANPMLNLSPSSDRYSRYGLGGLPMPWEQE